MKINSKSADGKTACLIYCADGEYRIRIYEPYASSFQDYDIKHNDLFFVIKDEDAYLYTDGIKHWIDHSPSTLMRDEKMENVINTKNKE